MYSQVSEQKGTQIVEDVLILKYICTVVCSKTLREYELKYLGVKGHNYTMSSQWFRKYCYGDGWTDRWVCVAPLLSRFRLLSDPVDCSSLGSSAHGIFSRQECRCGLPFPSPAYLPHPGVKPTSLVLAGGFFTTVPWIDRQQIAKKWSKMLAIGEPV